MNKVTKTITGTVIAATLVVTGAYIYKENEHTPVDIDFVFEGDCHVPINAMKITPKNKLKVMEKEDGYTLNDIISEIKIELLRTNGEETDRVKELENLRDKLVREAEKEDQLRKVRCTPPEPPPVEVIVEEEVLELEL